MFMLLRMFSIVFSFVVSGNFIAMCDITIGMFMSNFLYCGQSL